MLCQACKKNQATFHYTSIVNGAKEEVHLCEECMNKWKQNGDFADFMPFGKMGEFPQFGFLPEFSMADFVGGFFNPQGQAFVKQVGYNEPCPVCGMSAAQFRKQGRVGCKECYHHFSDDMAGLLRRIHGSNVHNGKIPSHGQEKLKAKLELEKLKEKMQQAIMAEEFEEAASLRDQIKALEKGDEKNV